MPEGQKRIASGTAKKYTRANTYYIHVYVYIQIHIYIFIYTYIFMFIFIHIYLEARQGLQVARPAKDCEWHS